MSVQNEIVKNRYVGNGSTTVFPFTFDTDEKHPEYIYVYTVGEDVNKIEETTNFTLDMDERTITYPADGSDPLADGDRLIIYRRLPLYQLLNLLNQGPFWAEDVEQSLDDLTFICQQLQETLGRCLKVGLGVDTDSVDLTLPWGQNKSFAWNDDGSEIILVTNPEDVLKQLTEAIENFEASITKELDSFESWTKEQIEELFADVATLHTADVEYVLALVAEMKTLIAEAKETLLTDLRYPISEYRLRTENTYGLEDAVILVNAARVLKFTDIKECEV